MPSTPNKKGRVSDKGASSSPSSSPASMQKNKKPRTTPHKGSPSAAAKGPGNYRHPTSFTANAAAASPSTASPSRSPAAGGKKPYVANSPSVNAGHSKAPARATEQVPFSTFVLDVSWPKQNDPSSIEFSLQERRLTDDQLVEFSKFLKNWVPQLAEQLKAVGPEIREELLGAEALTVTSAADAAAAKKKKKANKGKGGQSPLLKINLSLQRNAIGDKGVKALAEVLMDLRFLVRVKKVWLYMNSIGDEGARALARLLKADLCSIEELHLSHNRITEVGARALIEAVRDGGRYPLKEGVKPLWLRIEWNMVNLQAIQDVLATTKLCLAKERAACGPGMCKGPEIPLLHLYCLSLQKQPYKEAVLLEEAVRTIKEARAAAPQLPPPSQPQVSGEQVPAPLPPAASYTTENVLSRVPTYIFVDTNALLNMALRPFAPATGKSQRGSSSFTLNRLLKLGEAGRFGLSLPNPGDRVCLIITDTVIQELDHIKVKLRSRGPMGHTQGVLQALSALLREDGLLQSAANAGFLRVLGAHEGETLVDECGSGILTSAGSRWLDPNAAEPTLANDRKIIDVALHWNSQLGEPGNIILLSDDRSSIISSRSHNLPAISLEFLDSALGTVPDLDKKPVWTAAFIKDLIPSAFVGTDGKKIETTVKSSANIFTEMETAVGALPGLIKAAKVLLALNEITKNMAAPVEEPSSPEEGDEEEAEEGVEADEEEEGAEKPEIQEEEEEEAPQETVLPPGIKDALASIDFEALATTVASIEWQVPGWKTLIDQKLKPWLSGKEVSDPKN